MRLRRLPRVEMTRWRRAFDSCTVNSGRQHTNTIAAPFSERLHERGGAGPDSGGPGHQRSNAGSGTWRRGGRVWARA